MPTEFSDSWCRAISMQDVRSREAGLGWWGVGAGLGWLGAGLGEAFQQCLPHTPGAGPGEVLEPDPASSLNLGSDDR